MTVHKKQKIAGSLGILVVLLLEVIGFFLVMSIFMVDGGTILIPVFVIGAGVLIAFKKVPGLKSGIYAAFSNHKLIAIIVGFVLLLLPPFLLVKSAYWLFIVINALIFIIACLGLNLQLGSTGMMNLAGAAFMAFGAYSAGLLAINAGWPSWATLIAGAVITGLFSIILFIPVLKTKGHYLALVTIAFQFVVVILAENVEFTGGPQGLKNIPFISFLGYSFNEPINLGFITLHKYANYYYLGLALAIIVSLVCLRIYKSWVGVTAATIRDDEVAAKTNGVRVNYWKLVIFVLGNSFIGLAGAFFAHLIGFISPPNFVFDRSLVMVSVIILGGMDNVFGIIIGSILLITMPEKLRFIQEYRFLIYGLLLVIMLIFKPKGLIPFVPRDFKELLLKSKSKNPAPEMKSEGDEKNG
ncbi:MAG: branched-chain amino acid ABC transporter permease [Anaerolineaceae bacterium]|nr:branched-chain amino acid ABC transporter permease [Anaerolineaceae bacterium]